MVGPGSAIFLHFPLAILSLRTRMRLTVEPCMHFSSRNQHGGQNVSRPDLLPQSILLHD